MPGHTEAAASVGWTRVGNQKVATKTEHRQQYRTNRDAVDAIQKFICHLEGQRVLSKARSPFSSPVRPVQKSNGEWRLAVGCHSLGEMSPAVSAAVPDTAELQYKPEPTAAQWYSVTSTANAFFSVPVAPACRPQLEKCPAHLDAPAAAEETQAHRWPRTEPYCTRKRQSSRPPAAP